MKKLIFKNCYDIAWDLRVSSYLHATCTITHMHAQQTAAGMHACMRAYMHELSKSGKPTFNIRELGKRMKFCPART